MIVDNVGLNIGMFGTSSSMIILTFFDVNQSDLRMSLTANHTF